MKCPFSFAGNMGYSTTVMPRTGVKFFTKREKKRSSCLEFGASFVVSTQCCGAVLGGRHIFDGCDVTWLGRKKKTWNQEELGQKVVKSVEFYKSTTYFLSLRDAAWGHSLCVLRECVCVWMCRAEASVFAQAPWFAESYFVSVEKVWDGMSGLCLTEHVCACVGGVCV